MGNLTAHLQHQFARHLPAGWACAPEVPLLPAELTRVLGYDPRADVVLTNAAAGKRVWVEFEVSRADPVANHAKFATTHLFAPQGPADHFVAMLSPHIDRGRRNLAAATVRLMRRVGMSAFQTTLLPLATPAEVKRLNHLPADVLTAEALDVAAEVERVLTTVTPVGRWGRVDVHLAGDLLDVATNLRGWNEDTATDDGRRAWGRRACTYFVHDPASGLFAPSKFCAYVPVHPAGGPESSPWARMSAGLYSELNDGTHLMDGHRARTHLVRNLGMREVTAADSGPLAERFRTWLGGCDRAVTVRGGLPTLLVPPAWYSGGDR